MSDDLEAMSAAIDAGDQDKIDELMELESSEEASTDAEEEHTEEAAQENSEEASPDAEEEVSDEGETISTDYKEQDWYKDIPAEVKSDIGRVKANQAQNNSLLKDNQRKDKEIAELRAKLNKPKEETLPEVEYGDLEDIAPEYANSSKRREQAQQQQLNDLKAKATDAELRANEAARISAEQTAVAKVNAKHQDHGEIVSTDEFNEWALAQHTKVREQIFNPNGIPPEEVDDYIEILDSFKKARSSKQKRSTSKREAAKKQQSNLVAPQGRSSPANNDAGDDWNHYAKLADEEMKAHKLY